MRASYTIKTKANLISDETGQIKKIDVENVVSQRRMFPLNRKDKVMAYMDDFSKITELNKTEQLMFFAILKNCNEYNIVTSSWKDIAIGITTDQSRISKTIKSLKELKFIAKIESKHMVNPFIILPPYNREEVEIQWLTQQIWSLYTDNMNIHIPDEHKSTVNYILGIKESKYIKVGSEKYGTEKFIEKPTK